MSSVARVKFIKTKVIFGYQTKGVSNQVSSSDHEIKSYSCSNSSTKMGKTKKWEKISGLQNGAIRGLQIEAALGISNWAKRLQIGAKRFQIEAGITN